ncbi:hypothetical protein ACU4GR_23760 [Methylobacterium oryzae CBMB20]
MMQVIRAVAALALTVSGAAAKETYCDYTAYFDTPLAGHSAPAKQRRPSRSFLDENLAARGTGTARSHGS